MKRYLVLSLFLVGCATQSQYAGPKLTTVVDGCYAAGAQIAQMSKCVSSIFEQASPKWKEDADYPAVAAYLSTTDVLGGYVTAGKMTEPEARQASAEYLNQLIQNKRAQKLSAQQNNLSMMATGAAMMQYSRYPPPVAPAPIRNCTYREFAGVIHQTCF